MCNKLYWKIGQNSSEFFRESTQTKEFKFTKVFWVSSRLPIHRVDRLHRFFSSAKESLQFIYHEGKKEVGQLWFCNAAALTLLGSSRRESPEKVSTQHNIRSHMKRDPLLMMLRVQSCAKKCHKCHLSNEKQRRRDPKWTQKVRFSSPVTAHHLISFNFSFVFIEPGKIQCIFFATMTERSRGRVDGDRVSEHANICADVYYSSILKLSSFRIIRAGSHLRKNWRFMMLLIRQHKYYPTISYCTHMLEEIEDDSSSWIETCKSNHQSILLF